MPVQGTPPAARHIPIFVLFSPLFLLQGAGVLFAITRLVEKLVLLLRSGSFTGRYLTISSRTNDCFAFLHHGSRYLVTFYEDDLHPITILHYVLHSYLMAQGILSPLMRLTLFCNINVGMTVHAFVVIVCYCMLNITWSYYRLLGWWSIDEGSKEEQARLFQAGSTGYVTLFTESLLVFSNGNRSSPSIILIRGELSLLQLFDWKLLILLCCVLISDITVIIWF